MDSPTRFEWAGFVLLAFVIAVLVASLSGCDGTDEPAPNSLRVVDVQPGFPDVVVAEVQDTLGNPLWSATRTASGVAVLFSRDIEPGALILLRVETSTGDVAQSDTFTAAAGDNRIQIAGRSDTQATATVTLAEVPR